MNILFFEVGQNLVWKNVLQTITKDLDGFLADGGWGTVLGESDGEGDEDELGGDH
jgi:nucleosome binding factor SPN SPT16 subunit